MFQSTLEFIPIIPRLREMSKKPLARAGMRDSSGSYDSRRLSDLRGTAGPDRSGSGRDGRASSGPASERTGAAGPRDELRGCWSGAADRRRYDPDVAPGVRGRRGRCPGRIQLRGSRLPVDPGAAGQAEDLGRRHLAADDPDGRSVDRTRVRGCLREPFRADCAVASSGTGTSQARGGVAQARPGQTAGLHRRLRDAAEDAARGRGGDVRRRGASHPWGTAGGLLGAQGGQGRGRPGRDRLNIHGALDLETGRTRMIEVVTVDALSTIALLVAIEALYPAMRIIHVFLDNARYHHARAVQDWLAMPGRRIRLHFVPAYCPHLNPIERLWGLMHKTVTHNRCYATYNGFCEAVLGFLRRDVPNRWNTFCDSVTDNFRIISPGDFRVLR